MKGNVVSNSEVSPGYFELSFSTPLATASPGQFVMLKTTDAADPLLRRPMSVAGHEGDVMTVIMKVVGRGTQLLSRLRPGDTLDAEGPYGNSFRPAGKDDPPTLLVGGGIGVAPLLFWARRNASARHILFLGGASAKDILRAGDFGESHIATEDGSAGTKGLVTDVLGNHPEFAPGLFLLCCGPTGMLKAVEGLCIGRGISGELSLEVRMGCGFGVCLGCMVDTVERERKRCCVEGPVFKTGEVLWRT